MTSRSDAKKAKIAEYIDENLKKVFSELESDEMPDQIVDLLSVLRAQDEELKQKK
ncbi:NepR family anti-sigma factor [Lentibacter sp. XHP0401]|jgi:Anti-sigma factor NepR|uniref:NepR family anti-sigma factor n=1 Tax=Lentibacter sp. XHP0401 TaxID=2984334 RepID=UPI0021E82A39|nr:NepR family anti-sigma factor [Lentibacter sp. XHP0401]MCV2892237.1 NepR family anti-sigma factor [Lentibacter sp. XHP0401]